MTEYIWFKGGNPTKHTLDESGEQPTRLFKGGGVEIQYWYNSFDNNYSKAYFKHGKQHRDGDKPAFISYLNNGNVSYEYYCKNGKKHRDGDKPAYIGYNLDGAVDFLNYYKHGRQYTPSPTKTT